MEGRINPSPVLNAPPAKESDPFFARRLLFCRCGLAGETHFKKESFRCILTLLAPVATLLPTEPSPSPNVRFRPATFPRELRSVLGCPQRSFRASDEQHPRRFAPWTLPSLSFLLLGDLFGAPGLRHALLCATYSRSPTLSTFPLLPFDGLSNDRYRLRPSQRSQHLEWPLCARCGRSMINSFGELRPQKRSAWLVFRFAYEIISCLRERRAWGE